MLFILTAIVLGGVFLLALGLFRLTRGRSRMSRLILTIFAIRWSPERLDAKAAQRARTRSRAGAR